jgi:hypothetical protein
MTGSNCKVKMSGYGKDNLDNERSEESNGNGEGIPEGAEDGGSS